MNVYLLAGLLAGVAGLMTFLVIHHFWIQPIWFIAPIGLPMAAAGGLAVGWAYAELAPGLPPRPWTALALVGVIAAVLAPAVLLGEMRAPILDPTTFGIRPGVGAQAVLRVVFELMLPALLIGAASGWLLGHSGKAALATGVAGLVFAIGPGHNIPLLASTPSAGKGLLLLAAICLVSAVVMVEAAAWMDSG